MNIQTTGSEASALDLWGGLERTVNRVRETYFSRLGRNGQAARLPDVERLRFEARPAAIAGEVADLAAFRNNGRNRFLQPILITGAAGPLGSAFARLCESRHLAYRIVARPEMDMADPASVEAAIVRYRPWTVINAGACVRVDEAETDADRCFRENTLAPAILALACARHGLRFTTFSSDLVFDGKQSMPYVESDATAPIGVYGQSEAEAERRVLDANPHSLVIRSSAFFGPWDANNFVSLALDAIESSDPFAAADDLIFTPTYVPDLVKTCLDMIVDHERGIWHLSNGTAVTWAQLASMAAEAAGLEVSRIEAVPSERLGFRARRPGYAALGSERARLMPSLADALSRYVAVRAEGKAARGETRRAGSRLARRANVCTAS